MHIKNRIMKKSLLTLTGLMALTLSVTAQVKFGNNPTVINGSSLLELEHTNKGLLLPRVSLTSTTTWGLATATPVAGMQVYNTNASITGSVAAPTLPGGVGVYFWNGSRWFAPSGLQKTEADTYYWALLGNTGTNAATNFVGTTDAVDLVFRTNNLERLRITQTGRLDLSNTSGSATNIFVEGGNETTTGNYNTALGRNSLTLNTTGSNNVAVGSNSLAANINGFENVAVGHNALQGSVSGVHNTAIGHRSMFSNYEGAGNTAIGQWSMENNTGGGGNSAIGRGSLSRNTVGSYNTALGQYAIQDVINGDDNIGIGHVSGRGLTSGRGNIAIGYSTPFPSNTGNFQINISNIIYGIGANGGQLTPIQPAGKIGIGVPVPTEKLDVAGAVKVSTEYSGFSISHGSNSPVPSGGAGTIIFQGTNFFGWNGSSWRQLNN